MQNITRGYVRWGTRGARGLSHWRWLYHLLAITRSSSRECRLHGICTPTQACSNQSTQQDLAPYTQNPCQVRKPVLRSTANTNEHVLVAVPSATMQQLEAERQLENMCKFIRQEADEKANEIRVSAEEEFNLEKLQLLEQEKAKIRKEYERREAQVEVKKKIEYSKQLNEQRIRVLSAREVAIQEIVSEAKLRLREVSKNPTSYKKLLTDLLVQAMRKLSEKAVVVRCRQVDLILVKEVLEQARKSYTSAFNEEAPSLTLDQTSFLPPPPQGTSDDVQSCCGGVVAVSADGRITVSNTLDDRLKIAYQANLPNIRQRLFESA